MAKQWTVQEKAEALAMAEKVGVTEAARKMGIPKSTIGTWRKLVREKGKKQTNKNPNANIDNNSGRKPRITKAFISKAANMKKQGNYDVTVYKALGISHETWYKWIRWGAERPGSLYAEFVEAIKKAESEAESEAVKGILQAGQNGSWQAYAWFLERKHWQRWRRREGELARETKDPIMELLAGLKGEDNDKPDSDLETD
ncbi:transposase [Aminobacterium colombiense]